MKDFAKLFTFPDIGQVLVTLDETDDHESNGPEVKFQFVPEGLGVCAVRLSKFGSDEESAWKKAEDAFAAVDEAFAYKTAKHVCDGYVSALAEKSK